MLFGDFSQKLATIESLSSRLEMTDELVKLYSQLEPAEAKIASYLLLGTLRPAYDSLEFNLSIKMVLRALARLQANSESQASAQQTDLFGKQQVSESELDSTTQLSKKLGDIGLVAEQIVTHSAAESQLSVTSVYQELVVIAQESGIGSQEQKLDLLEQLLVKLDPVSAKFVARIVVGKMRLGFSTMTLIDALSFVLVGDKSARKAIEDAWQKRADIGQLATYLLEFMAQLPAGESLQLAALQQHLEQYDMRVGIPVEPQLCQRLPTPAEVIEKLGQVIAEPKYDGLRAQIHITKSDDGAVETAVFSRSMEDISYMFPELQQVAQQLLCQSVILDSEAIGFDIETGQLRPFQETITRKRKHGVAEQAAAIPIKFFVYDVLELNGRDLLTTPLQQRKEILKSVFTDSQVLEHAPFIITDQPQELEEFHTEQLAEGLEGAVVKQIDSPYQSGRKGWYWVKMKEKAGEFGKLTDTIDAVVLGYYVGRGKRTQFGLGAILVGLPNADGGFSTVAKIGTGMTEEQLREMKQRLDAVAVVDKPAEFDVNKNLHPDTWVQPQVVVEVAADEITNSPIHTVGKALRFPRLLKFRDDKSAQQATTFTELDSISVSK